MVQVSALVCLVLAAAGCDRDSGNGGSAGSGDRAAAKPLTLVVSGDTAGWITPCGCASNQSGGMLRRGSYLAEVRGRGGDVVYADAGGAAGGASEYHRVKFEAILAGEMKLQLAAHNVGRSEAELGPEYLREAAKSLGAPLVSANVTDAAGKGVAEPARVVQAGGRRVALVGVMSPKFATKQTRVTEPRQAILAAVSPLKDKYDSLVVLAYLPQDELERLAASLPEADAVVGGPTGQAVAPRRVGPTVLAAATNKGKFLVELVAGADGWTGAVKEMGATLADHPEQEANVRTYLAGLERRDFAAAETGLVTPPPPGAPAEYKLAGTQSCLECHAPDQQIWAHSKHSHAWDTIKAKGFHVDSHCQQCHTTGYGLPGGFESRGTTPELISVGCENCHGPSLAHARRPKVRTTFAAADQCVRCHDQENSPKFNYDGYWPRVRHGKGQTPDPAPGTQHAGAPQKTY